MFTSQSISLITFLYHHRIPPGTSAELCNLLMGLLKRNSVDRMAFDDFFRHSFMHKLQQPHATIETSAFMLGDTFTPPKTPSPIQLERGEDLGRQI